MKKTKLWVLADILNICGTAAFASCTANDDDPAVEKGLLLEIYDVQGSKLGA